MSHQPGEAGRWPGCENGGHCGLFLTVLHLLSPSCVPGSFLSHISVRRQGLGWREGSLDRSRPPKGHRAGKACSLVPQADGDGG